MSDPFEERLAVTPSRELPASWRRDILAAAGARRGSSHLATLLALFTWPRAGWTALAAAWVAILVLNVTGPRGPELYAVTPPELRDRLPSAREYLAYRERERALLLALTADEPWQPALRGPRPWEL